MLRSLLTIWFMCLTMKIVDINAECTRPIAGNNMVLSAESILHTTFPEGSIATFECIPGYSRRGSKSVTCTNGQWTEVKMQCQKKSCGSPGDVKNGVFDISQGIEFGATVVATCNTGFRMEGRIDRRTCQDAGWDGRIPTCEVITCGKPTNIVNGKFKENPEESYDFGKVVVYTCNTDYTMVGQESISCSETGEFTKPPTCEDVTCKKPDIKNAIRIEGNAGPYKYKSAVKYKCRPGYIMEGSAYLTCELNSEWSDDLPVCKVVCTKPIAGNNMVLSDESILHSTFPEGSNATFECIPGYSRRGSKSVTCTNGQWTDVKMQCQKKSCGSPGDVKNGVFDISQGIEFGATVVATCNTGFRMEGRIDRRTCQDAGWDGRIPTCEVITCGKPTHIVNGKFKENPEESYDYGKVVVYTCNTGYTMVGQESISCSDTGEFTKPPTCEDVTCKKPDIKNAIRIEGNAGPYKYKFAVKYKCNSGYTMEGSAYLTCEINGEWSADLPVCKGPVPGPTPTPTPSSNIGPVVGGVAAAIAIIGLVISFYWYTKNRSSTHYSSGKVATANPEEVEVVELPSKRSTPLPVTSS